MQTFFLAVFQMVVRGIDCAGFDAAHLMIDFMVGGEQLGKMRVRHFQLVDLVAELREFVDQVVLGDWPDVSPQTPKADVVTCHHVVYNVAQIEPFLKALDSHATKRVVIELPQQHPLSTMRDSWKHFWDLDRPVNPTPRDLIEVLAQMGIVANLELWQGPKLRPLNIEDDVRFLRIRLCLDSSRDADIQKFLEAQQPMQFRALATIWWDVKK